MKKLKRMVALLSAVLLLAFAGVLTLTVPAFAEDTATGGRTAAYATVAPTIDGVEDEIWSTTEAMTYERNWERSGVPAHQKAVVKMLWDADYLYILVRMEYTAIHPDNRFVELRICEDVDFTGLWNVSYPDAGGHGITIKQDGSVTDIYQIPMIVEDNRTVAVKENEAQDGFVAEIRVKRVHVAAFTDGMQIRFAASTYDHNYLNTGKLNNGIVYRGEGCRPGSCDTVTLITNPCAHENWADANCLMPRHCTGCGLIDSESAINPANHANEKQAVCNEDGTHDVFFPCCGVYAVRGEAHQWSTDVIVDRAPTCTEAGSRCKPCTVCGAKSEEEAIPPLGHEMAEDYTVDAEPTCTEAGQKSRHCLHEGCEEKADSTQIAPLGHVKGEWEQISAPTCRKKGTERIVCTRCGKSLEIRTVDELPHTGGEWIVEREATADTEGKRYKTCTVCGQRFDEEVIPALREETTPDTTEAPVDEPSPVGCASAVSEAALLLPLLAVLISAGTVRKRRKDI